MKYLRSIITWIASLETGGQFRKWVSILVKILGVFTLIVALVLDIAIFVGTIELSKYLNTGAVTLAVIGAILIICVNTVIGLVLVMLFWNRSNRIKSLGDETHFTLIPITVILIRLFGEFCFLSLVGVGIQSLIAPIFGVVLPDLLSIALSGLGRELSFIVGVISFVISVLIGAIQLIFFYFIAERMNLFVDMATNLKKIETALSTEENASDSDEEEPSDS